MINKIETTQNQTPPLPRKVSFLLGLGILVFPYFCVWFTLKKGYSTFSRCISFSWLAFLIITPLVAPLIESKKTPPVVSHEVNYAPEKISNSSSEEVAVDNSKVLENIDANLNSDQRTLREKMEAEIRLSKELTYATAHVDLSNLSYKYCLNETPATEQACITDVYKNKLPEYQKRRIAEDEAKIRAKYASMQ